MMLAVGPPVLAGVWFKPRLLITVLSFVPFFVFFCLQLRLRHRAKV